MDNGKAQWIEGATALGNARDWAREQREGVVKRANDAVELAGDVVTDDEEGNEEGTNGDDE